MTSWVLLRGLTRETRHWGRFPQQLREAMPDAEVLMLDLPGNGSLHALASPVSVPAMAEHCRAELQRRGVAPPYRLLAMSLGAMAAVAWDHAYPQELAGCVLINTSLRPFSPFYRRMRPRSALALLQLTLAGGSEQAWERRILQLTSTMGPAGEAVLDDWIAIRRERPVSRINAWRQLIAAARFRAPAIRPAVPLLVLASARDALVDSRCSLELARRWHAKLEVHPTAGHDLPLDDGPWVAEQVRRWMAGDNSTTR